MVLLLNLWCDRMRSPALQSLPHQGITEKDAPLPRPYQNCSPKRKTARRPWGTLSSTPGHQPLCPAGQQMWGRWLRDVICVL